MVRDEILVFCTAERLADNRSNRHKFVRLVNQNYLPKGKNKKTNLA